jgi:parallel beta-helix repeat protein
MTRIVLMLAVTFALGARAAGAADCPALDAGTLVCQEAIAKASASYAKAHLKAVEKCLQGVQSGKLVGDPNALCLTDPPGDAKTAAALTKAAGKVPTAIGKKCSDAQVAGLWLCAPSVAGLATCLVNDHQARLTAVIESAYGVVTPTSDKGVRKCQQAIGKEGAKYLSARLKSLGRCLNERNEDCGGPAPLVRCLAALSSGPPDEATAAAALAKAESKLTAKLAKRCVDAQVAALDTCGETVADAAACLVCGHGNGGDLLLAGAYRAVNVAAPGGMTIQAVADAADPEDTILLEPGTYVEEVELKDSGLTVRGIKTCDTGERAVIVPPTPTSANGITHCGSLLPDCEDVSDNVLFQGFEVNNFESNDILTVGVEGVTYRDMVTRGPGLENETEYGLFPILSNNVLVENCLAHGISDAAIYVGQSTNIIVRNNETHSSVAGIEIENSANAEVYGNYTHDNAGGLLVFKLPGLPVQLSDCHYIHDNRAENNNGVNYGHGTVALVPSGTGMIALSNDSTVFENNIITGNKSIGLTVVDQQILNLLYDPNPFPTPSPDQNVNDNSFIGNTITGNAFDPDPSVADTAADVVFLPAFGANNCQNGNTFATDLEGQFGELPACPAPPVQPGCPFVPAPTTTTTTTSTSTTSTSVPPATWTWSGEVWPLLNTSCASCHGGGGTPQYDGFANIHDQAAGYANIVNMASTQVPTMDRIEPGDHTLSYLWHKVNGTHADVGGSGFRMPQGGPFFSQEQLDGIAGWIDAGALND